MRLRAAIAGVASLGLGGLGGWLGSSPPSDITFLSVGQGDCTVFRTAGVTVLIDVGPASPTFDAGKRIVVPRLREMGVRSVDLILLTHPDRDHVGGLKSVREAFPEARVAISSAFRNEPKMLETLRQAHVAESGVQWLHGLAHARIGGFTIDIDCPPFAPHDADNDGCLFVRLASGQGSAVLTGDAPIEVENLLERDEDWDSEVLKVGHHGSRTSCGDEWLRAVHPEFAVVSCGLDNPYGHPNRETELRIASEGARELRTDLQGDVRFEFDGRRFALVGRG